MLDVEHLLPSIFGNGIPIANSRENGMFQMRTIIHFNIYVICTHAHTVRERSTSVSQPAKELKRRSMEWRKIRPCVSNVNYKSPNAFLYRIVHIGETISKMCLSFSMMVCMWCMPSFYSTEGEQAENATRMHDGLGPSFSTTHIFEIRKKFILNADDDDVDDDDGVVVSAAAVRHTGKQLYFRFNFYCINAAHWNATQLMIRSE